jgi:transcriptional regulator with XRE-family HTH domain
MMPPPIYVKSLIGLMKCLGWEQQGIAERLGISKTAISLWATGARPISRRYEQPFLDLVAAALRDDQARIHVGEAHMREVWSYIYAWSQEMYVRIGRFQEAIQSALETLQRHDAKQDPLSLSRSERARLRVACQALIRHLDYLDHLGTPIAQAGSPDILDPPAFFEGLRQLYSRVQQEER